MDKICRGSYSPTPAPRTSLLNATDAPPSPSRQMLKVKEQTLVNRLKKVEKLNEDLLVYNPLVDNEKRELIIEIRKKWTCEYRLYDTKSSSTEEQWQSNAQSKYRAECVTCNSLRLELLTIQEL